MIRASIGFGLVLALGLARQGPTPPFRTNARLVVVHATVRNSHGDVVTTLQRNAFTVYEDGKRQSITLFEKDDAPVSLGMLLDNSGSMRLIRSNVEAAALAFVHASNPQDEMFVVHFNDKARVSVPMTSDVQLVEDGIRSADAIGGTALRDAVDLAQQYLAAHAARDRKVLVVFSDGLDNASVVTRDDVVRQAERQETVLFGIGLFGDAAKDKSGRHELDELAHQTGGRTYYPQGGDGIQSAAVEIARQIRNQYTIAYEPTNQVLDGSYRTIRVNAAGSERLFVQTRAGYIASPSRP